MRYLEYRERRTHGTFDFPVAFYRLSPSHPRYEMVYHWHAEDEIIRVLSGGFRLVLNGRELLLAAGDCAFIAQGVLHGGEAVSDCVYECLVFDLNLLLGGNRICSRELAPLLHYERQVLWYLPAADRRIQPYADQLFAAVERPRGEGDGLLFLGCLCSFFAAVLHHGLYQPGEAGGGREQKKLARFKKVLSYIWAHYQEAVTLEDLARCSGMNGKYFCRFFREMTQRTPMEYLNYYRVECACEQLVITNKSVTEIALSCGFNDVSYFAKVFRKFKGINPSRYGRAGLGAHGEAADQAEW